MSQNPESTGWIWLSGTGTILNGPCLFYGLIMNSSANGATLTVYDGADASSGRKVGDFLTGSTRSNQFLLPYPLELTSGLRVEFDDDVVGALVLYTPLQP